MTREDWDKLTPDKQWDMYNNAKGLMAPVLTWKAFTVEGREYIPPIGDMAPYFEDGQWWTCHDSLIQHRKEKEAEGK